jgi:2-dehydro-3-deoxyphosphooctonate aldolase (KDO 8-P synthase)
MPIASKKATSIKISKDVAVGGGASLFLIAGPCVIESEGHALSMARGIKRICGRLKVPFVFKASYDKANRSSVKSFRGPGLTRGLEILERVKEELSIPVLSDVHAVSEIEKAAEVLDIIQIPAFLCRQTDLIVAAARTQKPLNLKKGQFLSPQEMENAVEKVLSQGNERIILTERGTFFGYNNLIFDIRSVPIMKKWGFPVAVDASHIVQKPGGRGVASGGEPDFIPYMVRAGVAVGADGLFLEVHDNPAQALSDGSNSLILNKLEDLLRLGVGLKRALARHHIS